MQNPDLGKLGGRYKIRVEKAFLKSYRRLYKRGKDMGKLVEVVRRLADGEALPARFRDHTLRGKWVGYRDCHIESDWVLIYRYDEGEVVLVLVETGTHSDILE